MDTSWANRPEALVEYQVTPLLADSIHVWDVTSLVRDWLSGRTPNLGLIIQPPSDGDFSAAYYSREIVSQQNQGQFGAAIPVGPRLVINCGGQLPQAVALNLASPTPTVQPAEPASSPRTEKSRNPRPTATLIKPVATAAAPAVAAPTAAAPTVVPSSPPTPVSPEQRLHRRCPRYRPPRFHHRRYRRPRRPPEIQAADPAAGAAIRHQTLRPRQFHPRPRQCRRRRWMCRSGWRYRPIRPSPEVC